MLVAWMCGLQIRSANVGVVTGTASQVSSWGFCGALGEPYKTHRQAHIEGDLLVLCRVQMEIVTSCMVTSMCFI
jgi:hypothetical protein